MTADLESLEQLVGRAAARIGELSRQNRDLAAEAEALRSRATAQQGALEAEERWRGERADVVRGLEEALAELREGE
jgi:hypothetical protein